MSDKVALITGATGQDGAYRLVCRESSILRGDGGRFTTPLPSRLCAAALAQLLPDAQALLVPSFDEGYGLPVVEALTLGTPVIASDIPVFGEITQDCACRRRSMAKLGATQSSHSPNLSPRR